MSGVLLRYMTPANAARLFEFYVRPMFGDPERKPLLLQLREMAWVTWKTRYWPHSYFKYRYFNRSKDVRELLPYVPGRLFDVLRDDVLNDPVQARQAADKFEFNRILRRGGVPATRVLGKYVKDKGFFDPEGRPIEPARLAETVPASPAGGRRPVVVKPASGSAQGDGVKIIPITDAKGLSEAVAGYASPEILLEEELEQHPAVKGIYPHSINTVRIDTLIRADGRAIVLGPILRVGRRGRRVDNWSGPLGGIAIGIDKATGRLQKTGYDYFLNPFDAHPDTGFRFEGAQVPNWGLVVEAALRAAALFPAVRSIGWDVASTPSGPVIIEGNPDYSIQSVQVGSGPYLKKKEFIEAVQGLLHGSRHRARFERRFTEPAP